ncbi:putative ferric reductase, partial [Trypanosoma theileri]
MPKKKEDDYDSLLDTAPQPKKIGARIYATFCILSGITSLGIASMGFGWWNGADYFHQGVYPNGWVGYDVFTFIGLLLFTVFSSSGVTLLYVGVSTLMRLWSGILGLAVFGALGVVLVVVGSLGMVWGNETMQCLGIFCVDTTKYVVVPGARPEAGLGFRSMIGMTAFFSLVPMGLVILAQV